jgi:pimeloyl-ACP methyl ester carboxylesterase
MKRLLLFCLVALPIMAADFREVHFETEDGGRVYANLYGEGAHAVVLAHGAVFNKESWQEQALRLAADGFQVLAIDFRGYGKSTAGSRGQARELDVMAAVRYLRAGGAEQVSVVGASMGGQASGGASAASKAGEITRLILLAPPSIPEPEKLRGETLFIVSEGDGLAASVRDQHARAPEPKRLVVLQGSAHAQHIFKTEQAEGLMALILDWLKKGP